MEVYQPQPLALPDEEQFKHDMQAINRFQQIVHSTMVVDLDYGIIPGTQKPTLLKPGAEKIAKLLGLSDQYEILDKAEDWQQPLFRYLIKCRLVHLATGSVISEGLGECNSMESKYRWRESKRKCPICGAEAIIKGKEQYGGGWLCFRKTGGCGAKFEDGDSEIEEQQIGRVENDDIYSQVNTILKMAKKRALVDAALSAGRLSDIFTQDMEDTGRVVIKEQPEQKLKQDLEEELGETEEPAPEELKEKEPGADLANLILRNPGEFYTACLEHFKLSKSKVDAEIPEYDITKVDQRKKAWGTIIAIYGHRKDKEA